MTKDELWEHFVRKNPAILTTPMMPRGIRKLFNLTWDKAQEDIKSKRDVPDFLKSLGMK